ncbi:Pentatricopeptide repeat-containing protein [Thalictrum thalictroides]|uniref:Pentatricopeptide repeat-containing protein n=2 Tax=Thalictrum thalictroides TaxID=46969 RepID=A0A7J6W411_THATH|nr:Pentatricopeptide repeat-containing protein [Thalictrum thalictroides]
MNLLSADNAEMHRAPNRGMSAPLNRMLNDYIRKGQTKEARKLFDESPESRDIVTWNSMISAYIRNNQIQHAHQLFDTMPERDVVSWNTMLSGFQRVNDLEIVVGYFVQMGRVGIKPSEFTLATVISSISSNCSFSYSLLMQQVHGQAISLGFNLSVFVGSALIGGYEKLGCKIGFCKVFDEILVKDVTSWNALILGYMNLGFVDEGCKAFEMMPERNVVSWTSLVNGLIKNRKLDEGRLWFDRMPEKNTVSWTVMISGYERNGLFMDALELFVLMWKLGVPPNQFTFSSVVSACAGCSSLVFGMQVHLNILKSGMPVDVILSSSLVDMYAKCGDINVAVGIFEDIPIKNLECWNSIIGGYARHGYGIQALEEFERMKGQGHKPDQITFVNVLSACAHGGLVEEGELHFESMERMYGIQAEKEHYACMVDLYGRSGHLEKAENLIRSMPLEPDVVVWGAMLGACGMHSSLGFALFAAEEMYKLEKDHPAMYSLLSKIHGDKGGWSRVIEMRKMMKQVGAKKQTASSWIES